MWKFVITLMVVLLLSPATGICGGAVNFDGVDDNVNVGSTINLKDFPSGTLSMWCQTDTLASEFRLSFGARAGTANSRIYMGMSLGKWYVAIGDGSTQRSFDLDYEYHHIAMTWDGSTMFMYNDGIFYDSTSYSTTESSDDTQTNIGSGTGASPSARWDGRIGEVLIYTRALSAAEINAIYASRNAWYPKTGLVSRWSMENNGINTGQSHPNGSTVTDSAGSNDGTISDGADNSMTLESSPTRKKRGRR